MTMGVAFLLSLVISLILIVILGLAIRALGWREVFRAFLGLLIVCTAIAIGLSLFWEGLP